MFVLETYGGVVLMVHPAVRILWCCGSLGDVDALAERGLGTDGW